MKYIAFISYSHTNQKWGRRIHRRLEAYRVPKAIVGSAGRDGPLPQRLGRVFRDREELPTSADLGSTLVDALDTSSYLVVICSPASAASRWVNEEVLHFKRTGRANRIFPFIIEGEPHATDRGQPERECFPPAIRFALTEDGELSDQRVEPIAADARSHADGPANAMLKLIAGLLGTDFDALKQREARRARARRVRLSAIAASVSLVVLISAVFAVVQLNRAEHAESLSQELQEVAQNLKAEWARGGVETTPEIDAVLMADLESLERLAPTPAQINELWGPEDLNLLMIACAVGHADVVEWLLKHGADPMIYNPDGYAAVHIAADRGRPGGLEPLKNAGVDLDMPWESQGGQGWRAMDIAADDESIPVLAELNRLGVSFERDIPASESGFRDSRSYAPPSPLFMAAYFGQLKAIQFLLDSGADPNIRNIEGKTPYDSAVGFGQTEAAALLAPQKSVEDGTLVNEQLLGIVTMLGMQPGGAAKTKDLLARGANPNFVTDSGGTILGRAAAVPIPQVIEVMDLLLEAGGDPMLPHSSHSDESIFVRVVQSAMYGISGEDDTLGFHDTNMKLAEMFLEAGADPDAPTQYSQISLREQVYQSDNEALIEIFKRHE